MNTQNNRAYAQAAVVAAGIGLLLGGTWAARGLQDMCDWFILPAGRVAAIVFLVTCAIGLRARPIKQHHLFVIAAAAFAGHMLCLGVLAYGQLAAAETSAVGFASFLFDGLFIASAFVLLLQALSGIAAQQARIAVATGLAVATTYDLIVIQAGSTWAGVQWVLSGALVLALCFVCVRAGAIPVHNSAPSEEDTSSMTVREHTQFAPWAAAMTLVTLLMLVQGVVSQVTGYGGAGQMGRFGSAGDIISLVTRCVVLGYCIATTRVLRPLPLSIGLAGLWCIALTGIVCEAFAGSSNIGELCLEASYNIAQAAALLFAYDFAQRHPEHYQFIACIGVAVMLANQLTRLIGMTLLDAPSAAPAQTAIAGCVGLAVIAFALCALLGAVEVRNAQKPTTSDQTGAQESEVPQHLPETEITSPFVAQALDFAHRFDSVCALAGLTPREREVLFYAVHGYTIDNIADKLIVSRETVKSNLARAYTRAGVNGKQAFLALIDQAE